MQILLLNGYSNWSDQKNCMPQLNKCRGIVCLSCLFNDYILFSMNKASDNFFFECGEILFSDSETSLCTVNI